MFTDTDQKLRQKESLRANEDLAIDFLSEAFQLVRKFKPASKSDQSEHPTLLSVDDCVSQSDLASQNSDKCKFRELARKYLFLTR